MPGQGASLPISFRTSLHGQPCTRPLGASLHFAGFVQGAQPVMVFPRLWSQPSGPVVGHGSALLHSLCSASFRRLRSFHAAASLFHYSFACHSTTLHIRFAQSGPAMPQGLHIVYVRHPAGPLRLRLRFWCPAD